MSGNVYCVLIGLVILIVPAVLWSARTIGGSINNTGSVAQMYEYIWEEVRALWGRLLPWRLFSAGAALIIVGLVLQNR